MNKIILIGGGLAVAVVAFVVVKSRANSTAQENQNSAPAGYMDAPAPIGFASAPSGLGGGGSPTDPSNSGSTDAGGGFDITSILGKLFDGQVQNQALDIRTGAQTADSAFLASLNFGAYGGTAAFLHGADGTSLSVKPNGDGYDALVNNAYSSTLKRAPDIGGAAFFKDQLTHGTSYGDIIKQMMNSPEYKSLHPPTIVTEVNPYNGTPTVTTTTTTDTGGTMSKSQS